MNEYAEGSLEWRAWGEGYAYAERTGGAYDAPLSGEWADMPTIADVGTMVGRHVFGADYSPDDYAEDRESGVIDDFDEEAILEAFEHGYADWRGDN